MLFNSEKEVNTYIVDNGFFINKSNDELCVKCSKTDFKKINSVTIGNTTIDAKSRLLSFISYNSYPFIDFESVKIPSIDTGIFRLYDSRNERIQENKSMQDAFNQSKNVHKKNFKLVHFDVVNSRNNSHYFMYNTKNHTLSEYDKHLLEDSDIEKRIEFKNILHFNNVMNDSLENEFSEEYAREKAKFDELKINKVLSDER